MNLISINEPILLRRKKSEVLVLVKSSMLGFYAIKTNVLNDCLVCTQLIETSLFPKKVGRKATQEILENACRNFLLEGFRRSEVR